MTAALTIIEAGPQLTVQDLGRPATQHLGMPVSGALDPVALRLANALVGNAAGEAALEIRLIGPVLEVAADSVRMALTGTWSEIAILSPAPARLPAHQSVRLPRGCRFRIAALGDGATATLALEGGFALPEIYGSRSTCIRAGIGGFKGRALRPGDSLPLRQNAAPMRAEVRLADARYLSRPDAARLILGPQQDYFTDAAHATLLSEAYTVTPEADRMGMRLGGTALTHKRGYNIVSDGIATGAVQVPGNGLPIILLADHQTTGGYPKIATLASADLPWIGRLRPGDEVRFRAVNVEEAEAARHNLEAAIARICETLAPAEAWLDRAALYRENLISGVL